jgi:rhodanese-related sulfurtransferase
MVRRWLELEGAVNARDVGGLPLDGGGATRPGALVRTDNLQSLTDHAVAALEQYGVRLVVDLRTAAELELEGPGPLTGRVEIRHRSLYPEAGVHTDAAVEDLLPWHRRGAGDPDESPVVRSYLGYLADRPDSVVAALRDVAEGDGATIVHCAAGKDRTGVVVALALEAAGVERAAVVADYVATAERMSAVLARLRASPTYAADLDGLPDDVHLPRAETLERVLALLDERHGGPRGWLEAHGFGAGDVAALRTRLA